MAKIKRLWLLTVTSTESFAGTHAGVRLEIVSRNGNRMWADIGDPNQNDRECGQTGCHELVLSETEYVDDTQIQEIRLRINDGPDAWLPKSIWIISENVDGGTKLLSADPDWNRWFDPESRPGYALRLLPQ
ncbi:MAG: PLAT/LH2 domain-containing protein [Planctomycetota bacterium]